MKSIALYVYGVTYTTAKYVESYYRSLSSAVCS